MQHGQNKRKDVCCMATTWQSINTFIKKKNIKLILEKLHYWFLKFAYQALLVL